MASASDLRDLALALPGTSDYPHFDRTAFRTKRVFATLAPDGLTANLLLSPDEQALKCEVAPEAFQPHPSKWGAHGWTLTVLSALSREELAAALALAHARSLPAPAKRKR